MQMKLILSVSLLSVVAAFWRMPCNNVLSVERLDPIVNPDGIAGHVHNIAGGSNFGPNSDYTSLRQSSCTSCPIKEDLSAYWTPQLYFRYENGSFISVPNGGLTVYYLQRTGSNGGNVTAFPEGFRMLSGNPSLRAYDASSRAQQAVNFVCLNSVTGNTYTNSLPDTDCPNGLRLQIVFPSCWDGVNLDSPNHKSHLAFPTSVSSGQCDDSRYPVRLVTLFYEVFYDVTSFKSLWYSNKTPFVLANGDPTGYSFHGDFINGWDVPVLQNALNTCTDMSGVMQDCQAFTIAQPASDRFQCHKSPSVNEIVLNTVLPSLPGCNPVTNTAASSAPMCSPSTAPTLWLNTTGYQGNVVPDGYHALANSPSIVKAYKQWTLSGCYQDASSRVLPQKMTLSTAMSVEGCLDACAAKGYSYAGLEYGQECWCGNALVASPLSIQSCSMQCVGQSSEYCGAGMSLLVYTASQGRTASSSTTSQASSTVAVQRQGFPVNGRGTTLQTTSPTLSQSQTSSTSSTTTLVPPARQGFPVTRQGFPVKASAKPKG